MSLALSSNNSYILLYNFMHAYYDGMALDETFHVAVVNISTDARI